MAMKKPNISDTINEAIQWFFRELLGPIAERVESGQSAATLASARASGKKKAPKYVEGSEDDNGKPSILDTMREQQKMDIENRPFQRELLGSTGVSDAATQRKRQREANFDASLDRNRQARALGDRGAKEAGLPLAPKYGRGGYVDAMGVETPSGEDTPQEKKYKAFKVLLEAEGNRRLGEQRQPLESAMMGTSMEPKIIALRKMLGSGDPQQRLYAEQELRGYGITPEY